MPQLIILSMCPKSTLISNWIVHTNLWRGIHASRIPSSTGGFWNNHTSSVLWLKFRKAICQCLLNSTLKSVRRDRRPSSAPVVCHSKSFNSLQTVPFILSIDGLKVNCIFLGGSHWLTWRSKLHDSWLYNYRKPWKSRLISINSLSASLKRWWIPGFYVCE